LHVSLKGYLQLQPCIGRAIFNCPVGLQPESAACIYCTTDSTFLHRGEICQASWNTAQKKVTLIKSWCRHIY